MADIAELERTLQYIKGHPEEWDQQRYHACFAGLTLRRHGAMVASADHGNESFIMGGRKLWNYDIALQAQGLLDLTDGEAYRLFTGGNSIEDLERIVSKIKEKVPA